MGENKVRESGHSRVPDFHKQQLEVNFFDLILAGELAGDELAVKPNLDLRGRGSRFANRLLNRLQAENDGVIFRFVVGYRLQRAVSFAQHRAGLIGRHRAGPGRSRISSRPPISINHKIFHN